ncbi:hypothetical protein HPP92_023804 [Vanilla planifolia]|uniref:Uncharacterized protein n=1 Tax=Vanilla planifolia TaxID=51239 RepID=A0A835PQT7_VANPL|nr:hypothetical protein HPP92_023804 [Vanilla planifolia]
MPDSRNTSYLRIPQKTFLSAPLLERAAPALRNLKHGQYVASIWERRSRP